MHSQLPLTLLAALLLMSAAARGQTQAPTPAPDPLAGLSVQVLDQQQVDAGDHLITLNRIAPPHLPVPAPTPAPAVSSSVPSADPGPGKRLRAVTFSLSLKRQMLTELRGFNAAKPELRAHLNFDSRLLGSIPQIQTPDAAYLYIVALDADTIDPEADLNLDLPTSPSRCPSTPPTR